MVGIYTLGTFAVRWRRKVKRGSYEKVINKNYQSVWKINIYDYDVDNETKLHVPRNEILECQAEIV